MITETLFIFLLLIYYIVAIIFSIIWLFTKRARFPFYASTALFIPIFGLFLVLMAFIREKRVVFDKREVEKFDDLILTSHLLQEEEINIPIEEALIINDYATRRRTLMEIFKYNPMKYTKTLKKAVANDDTETVHYASTIISELQKKITANMIEKGNIAKKENTASAYKNYANALKEYFESDFFDKQSMDVAVDNYCDAIDHIISLGDNSEEVHQSRVESLLRVKSYEKARRGLSELEVMYPENENLIYYRLKLLYSSGNVIGFKSYVEELMQSSNTQDSYYYDLVKFWGEKEDAVI